MIAHITKTKPIPVINEPASKLSFNNRIPVKNIIPITAKKNKVISAINEYLIYFGSLGLLTASTLPSNANSSINSIMNSIFSPEFSEYVGTKN